MDSRNASGASTPSASGAYSLEVSHLRQSTRSIKWERPRLRDKNDSRGVTKQEAFCWILYCPSLATVSMQFAKGQTLSHLLLDIFTYWAVYAAAAEYSTRFSADGSDHRLFYLLLAASIFFMDVNFTGDVMAPGNFYARRMHLSSLAACYVLIGLMHARVAFWLPACRRFATFHLLLNLATVALYIGAANTRSDKHCEVLCWMACALFLPRTYGLPNQHLTDSITSQRNAQDYIGRSENIMVFTLALVVRCITVGVQPGHVHVGEESFCIVMSCLMLVLLVKLLLYDVHMFWICCLAIHGGMPSMHAGHVASFIDGGHAAMLISGATSKKELCMVSRTDKSGRGFLALEQCEDAVRQKDGREIWWLSPSGRISDLAGRCLQATQSGELSLLRCQDAQAWQLTGNNRIQLGDDRAGLATSCLTVPPTASVTLDVAKGQVAKSTSSSDLAHSAEHAVDGNPATYWASDLMGEDADAAVSWQVSFPRSRLNSVDIEWEYAPQQFDLQISKDGDSWKTAYSVSSNPLNSERSHIRLDGIEAQAARLVFGSIAALAHHVGIRHFRVTSISAPVLERCTGPSMARAKWFLATVAEFDPAKLSSKQGSGWRPNLMKMDKSWVLPAGMPTVRSSFANISEHHSALASEHLKPLVQWRQQHRRTLEGFLCAAAFVQDRHVYTNCTDAMTPNGDSGREWCYLDPELVPGLDPSTPRWGYCAPVTDYDAARAAA